MRRIRLAISMLALIASLALLLWSFWPAGRETRIQNLQPTQMQLPTPSSALMPADPVACLEALL